ncbi:hypothetical protein LSAT2_025941, partial [Lamellibrachia satsuma]
MHCLSSSPVSCRFVVRTMSDKMLVWILFCVLLTDIAVTSSVTEFRVGVILITGNGSPYDIKRSGAAVMLAFDEVNRHLLNDNYKIVPIMRTYGPKCDANKAPGKLYS